MKMWDSKLSKRNRILLLAPQWVIHKIFWNFSKYKFSFIHTDLLVVPQIEKHKLRLNTCDDFISLVPLKGVVSVPNISAEIRCDQGQRLSRLVYVYLMMPAFVVAKFENFWRQI